MSVFKKILSLTLVFLLVFSCLPTAAFADEIENETEVTEEAAVDDEVTIQKEVPAEEPAEESPEEPPEEESVLEESEEIISEEVSETVPEDENEESTEEPDPEEDPKDETDPVETEAPEDSEGEEISEEEEPSVEEETDSEPVSEEIEEDTEQEEAEEKPEEEPVPVPCIFTVELQDVRDNITIRRNGQIVAAVYGNPAPGDGHYFIVGPVRLEELSSDPDGNTRLSFEAMTGDEFTIETVQPVYANIRYYSPYSFDVSVQNGVVVLSITLEGDTSIQVNGDYSAAAGFFPVGVRRALRASGVWTPPDAIYVSLGNCYDTYSSTAIVNGHTNVPMKDPAMLLIRKWDVDTDSFVPQGNGSFAGARYRLDYYDNTDWSGTPKASWVLESDANGVIKYLPDYKVSGPDLYKWGDAYLLPLGSIKITEVKAPEGYRMSTDVLYATITQNGNDGILKWTTETQGLIKAFADGIGVPENAIYGGVRFKKVDRETSKSVAGAKISIYSNCDADILVDGGIYSRGDLIVTLTTNENGTCETGADYLPYGSYYAVETKASDKYLLNEEWRVDFNITENGKIVDLTTGDNLLKEQIIRGDLSMLKLDIDGHYKPNIPFMIVQIDENGEEGEWHVIVTDENGMIDTSAAARPHTNSTNSLDQYVDGGVFTDASKLDPTVGIWFGDSQPDNSLGALPYGNYKVYELQTEQLAEEQINILESKIIEIHEPGVTVVLSPMVNLNIDLKSEAASAGGKDFIPAAAVRVVDTVHYTNLTSYRRYTMETQFVLKSTSEVLATVSKDFYPPEGPAGTNTAKGSVTLEAEIDVTDHPGDCVVACDYLYEYVKGTKILIASHADMEDKAQTLKIPDIHTTARDSKTGDNVGTVSENAQIIDTVYYTNLKRGEVFMLVAKLCDSETGEIIKGADGEDLTVEKRFVCWKEEDSVDMPAFEIDSTQYVGRSVVVFEELYWIDEEHDNEPVLMTIHESLDDKDQTICYPEVHTTATDKNTDEHIGVVSEVTVIEDTVQLTDLIAGQEYTVTGVLVYKEACTDAEGKTHKAGDPFPVKDSSENNVTFIADAAETEVTLTYVVDASLLEGTTAVVFEDLIHNGIKVASHADLEDKEQTVHFPKLKTQAIDKTSGTSFVTKGSEVYFVDTVSYSNVVPGLSYVVKGELMDKNTGEPLACYAVSDVFVPTAANGTVQVEFLVDSERIPSTIIVVFEDLYLVKEDGSEVLIEKHEDLNDEDQSLYHPEIRTTAVNAETGTHEAQGKTKTVMKDTVAYSNLKPGEEYTVIGILMDKATGNPIVINGERVTSKAVFAPAEKDGFVEVTFEFDATRLVGKTSVVFERLLYQGIEIADHADIEDEGQSVNIIDIRTSAVDSVSNSHEATWDHKAKVIDTVTYTGLTPGKTYTVYGTVMLKGTGEVLIQNGILVTGMTEFVPKETDGTVEVSFVVDTYLLQGMEIVVFERLFAGSVTDSTLESDVPIAVHEDINDKDQTVKVPVIPFTPPHTGVDDHMGLLLTTMLTSGAGAIWIFSRKKRH